MLSGPLAEYRALDLTDEKGMYCGALLAQVGVDVIKVEKPGGDPVRSKGPFYQDVQQPERSLLWFFLNSNKRGITLNLSRKRGREILKQLIQRADFLIEDYPLGTMQKWGLDYNTLKNINPRLIHVSITPFGQSGPYSSFKTSELVAMAASGYLFVTGDTDRPPVNLNLPLAYLFASLDAADGALIAHIYREKTGLGQHIDTSIQHSASWLAIRSRIWWEISKKITHRSGQLYQYTPGIGRRFVWECKDGAIQYTLTGGATGARQNQIFSQWLQEEGIDTDILKDVDWAKADIPAIGAQLEKTFQTLFSRHTKAEILEQARKRGIILGTVDNIEEVMNNRQLKARKFWEEVHHPELSASLTYPGAFFKSSGTPCVKRSRAPRIGEHNWEIYQEIRLSSKELQNLEREGVI